MPFNPPPLDDVSPATTAPATQSPTKAPQRAPQGRDGQHTSHAYAVEVRNMQEAMIMLGNALANLTTIFDVSTPKTKSDTHNPDNAKLLGIDPNTVSLIRNISKNVHSMPAGYADGLWGPKTQAALNAIFNIVKAIDSSKYLDQNRKAKYDGILTFLQEHNANDARWQDISSHGPVVDSAREIRGVIETNMQMIVDDLKSILEKAKQESEIPSIRDARIGDAAPSSPKTEQDGSTAPSANAIPVSNEAKSAARVQNMYPNGFPMPFDLNTNQLNMDRIKNFIVAVSITVSDPQVRSLGGNDFATLGNALLQYINQIESQEDSLKQALGGKLIFTIDSDSSEGYQNFFQGVAVGNDFNAKKSSSETILSRTILLCNSVVETLRQFQNVPTFAGIIGTDMIQAQANKGANLVRAAYAIRSYIERLRPGA
jgi:hypothetical protein